MKRKGSTTTTTSKIKEPKNLGDITELPFELWMIILDFIPAIVKLLLFPRHTKDIILKSTPVPLILGKYLTSMFSTWYFSTVYFLYNNDFGMQLDIKPTTERINQQRLIRTLLVLQGTTFTNIKFIFIDSPYIMELLLQNHRFTNLETVIFKYMTAKSFFSPNNHQTKVSKREKEKRLIKIFANTPSMKCVKQIGRGTILTLKH
jgi:hypothetical protein